MLFHNNIYCSFKRNNELIIKKIKRTNGSRDERRSGPPPMLGEKKCNNKIIINIMVSSPVGLTTALSKLDRETPGTDKYNNKFL